MRIGLIGINHKQAGVALREKLAKKCLHHFRTLRSHQNVLLLSTCNRTELYFSSDNLAETHSYLLHVLREEAGVSIEQKLYSFFSVDTLHHLSRVTAGLDSALLGESEIQRQVKQAYLDAIETRKLPKELHFLFQKSLKNGKLIRSSFTLGQGMPETPQALFQRGQERLNLHAARILFVGASAINMRVLNYFKQKKLPFLTLTNRNLHKAQELCDTVLPWEQKERWMGYDWLIFGTKAEAPLLYKKDIFSGSALKLITDLGVPRNVSEDVSEVVCLDNIDDVQSSLKERKNQLTNLSLSAEELLEETVLRQAMRYQKTVQASLLQRAFDTPQIRSFSSLESA